MRDYSHISQDIITRRFDLYIAVEFTNLNDDEFNIYGEGASVKLSMNKPHPSTLPRIADEDHAAWAEQSFDSDSPYGMEDI